MTTHEQSLLVSNGFIRSIECILSCQANLLQTIPTSVVDLISAFIGDLFVNEGSYTWKIIDPLTVDKILHANNGDKFISDPFIISRIKYQLEVYPNGEIPELSGYFMIYLRILSLPKYVKNITIARVFRVLENKAGAGFFDTINIDQPDYWTRKCPLSELVAINPSTITVQVEIMINKILLNDLSVLDNYPLKPSSYKEFDETHHLEFTLDETALDLIRNIDDETAPHIVKAFCSDIVNDEWYITMYPLGSVYSGEFSEQELIVDFGWYKWPRNVS